MGLQYAFYVQDLETQVHYFTHYSHFFLKVQWNFQAVMSSDRMGGASAAISGGTRLWVTGGVPSAHGRPPIV